MGQGARLKIGGFICLGAGILLHVIGLFSPYWHLMEILNKKHHFKQNYGLWQLCIYDYFYPAARLRDECGEILTSPYMSDYIRATQFFETVGFLSALASLILLLLCVIITSCRDRKILPILSAIAAFGACGCIILGCIIFGAKDNEKDFLSWAFALALVGGIIFGLAGVIIIVFAFIKKPVQNSML